MKRKSFPKQNQTQSISIWHLEQKELSCMALMCLSWMLPRKKSPRYWWWLLVWLTKSLCFCQKQRKKKNAIHLVWHSIGYCPFDWQSLQMGNQFVGLYTIKLNVTVLINPKRRYVRFNFVMQELERQSEFFSHVIEDRKKHTH